MTKEMAHRNKGRRSRICGRKGGECIGQGGHLEDGRGW